MYDQFTADIVSIKHQKAQLCRFLDTISTNATQCWLNVFQHCPFNTRHEHRQSSVMFFLPLVYCGVGKVVFNWQASRNL